MNRRGQAFITGVVSPMIGCLICLILIGAFILVIPSFSEDPQVPFVKRRFCRSIDDNVSFNSCFENPLAETLDTVFPIEKTTIEDVNNLIGRYKTDSIATSSGYRETYIIERYLFDKPEWEFTYDENNVLTSIQFVPNYFDPGMPSRAQE